MENQLKKKVRCVRLVAVIHLCLLCGSDFSRKTMFPDNFKFKAKLFKILSTLMLG